MACSGAGGWKMQRVAAEANKAWLHSRLVYALVIAWWHADQQRRQAILGQ